nr:hypothetical protein [Gemmatimonadota bacterium]
GLLLGAWLLGTISPDVLAALAGAVGGADGAGPRATARAATLASFPVSFSVTVFAWTAAAALLWWGIGQSRLSPSAVAGALGLLLVVDLWRVDARYLDVVDIDSTFAADAAESWLAEQTQPFRILPLPGTLGPNESILHRLEAVYGLQKFRLTWYDKLMGGAGAPNLGKLPLWRVLNLTYVVAPGPIRADGLTRPSGAPEGAYRWGGTAPRAWIAAEARVVEDAEALRLLESPTFDPARVALLAEPLPGAEARPGEGARPAPGPAGSLRAREATAMVRYLARSANHVEAEVSSPEGGVVMFSEAFHPYWEAMLDGRRTPIVRADLAFRAVAVPAGTHRVRMDYRPRAYERARIVTLVALSLAGCAGVLDLVRRRRRPRAPTAAETR